MRLDQFLKEKRGIRSRTLAADLIKAGAVELFRDGKRLNAKASTVVDAETRVHIQNHPLLDSVSRGVLKLVPALNRLQLRLDGQRVLDIGQSTGGFTQSCLDFGAGEVVGVDIGHGQLDARLVEDSRVKCHEGVNARDLDISAIQSLTGYSDFDLVVMDVSFISIKKIVPNLSSLKVRLLSLVKPQFELGSEHLNKSGIVKNDSLYEDLEQQMRYFCQSQGFSVIDYFESEVRGKNGNKEFFIYAKCDS